GPAAPEQGDDAHEDRGDDRVDAVERHVLLPEDGAPPEGRGGQDEDVDYGQLAQPRPHDRSGLADRVSPHMRRNRLPGGEALSFLGRRVLGGGRRPGPLSGGFGAGGPAPRPIRRRACLPGGRQEPVSVRALVLGQESAYLGPQVVVPTAGEAEPGLPAG